MVISTKGKALALLSHILEHYSIKREGQTLGAAYWTFCSVLLQGGCSIAAGQASRLDCQALRKLS